jgi:hypothetical protein
MEYLTGILIGYFFKEIINTLKKITKYDDKPTETWDFLTYDDLP